MWETILKLVHCQILSFVTENNLKEIKKKKKRLPCYAENSPNLFAIDYNIIQLIFALHMWIKALTH